MSTVRYEYHKINLQTIDNLRRIIDLSSMKTMNWDHIKSHLNVRTYKSALAIKNKKRFKFQAKIVHITPKSSAKPMNTS